MQEAILIGLCLLGWLPLLPCVGMLLIRLIGMAVVLLLFGPGHLGMHRGLQIVLQEGAELGCVFLQNLGGVGAACLQG